MENILAANRQISLADLEENATDGSTQVICGLITTVARRQTKAGAPWATLTIEDLDASVTVLVFPKVYEQAAMSLATDVLVRVRGRVSVRDDVAEIQANEITVLNAAAEEEAGPIHLEVPASRCTPVVLDNLHDVLSAHPGSTEVQLKITSSVRNKIYQLADSLRVTPSQPLMADLKALLGPAAVTARN